MYHLVPGVVLRHRPSGWSGIGLAVSHPKHGAELLASGQWVLVMGGTCWHHTLGTTPARQCPLLRGLDPSSGLGEVLLQASDNPDLHPPILCHHNVVFRLFQFSDTR